MLKGQEEIDGSLLVFSWKEDNNSVCNKVAIQEIVPLSSESG